MSTNVCTQSEAELSRANYNDSIRPNVPAFQQIKYWLSSWLRL